MSGGIESMAEDEKASSYQIGGSWYSSMKIQPVDFIHKNNIGFLEGCAIKYLVRHRKKNGLEDLKKARHYINLLIELEYNQTEQE